MEDHRQTGVTLFELLATLALIGILAGLAVPAFRDLLVNARLRSAATSLSNDIRQARRDAIHDHRPRFISFQPGQNGHWRYCISARAEADCRQAANPASRFVENDRFSGIDLNQVGFGRSTIRFSAVRGTANPGRLTLSAGPGKQISVILSPLGRVRLCSNSDARYPAC